MAKVTMRRIVLPENKDRDYSIFISFVDLDGRQVSLSFDGRYEYTEYPNSDEKYDYPPNAMCPIINGCGEYLRDSDDLQVMRNLRDSLNDLNLGD